MVGEPKVTTEKEREYRARISELESQRDTAFDIIDQLCTMLRQLTTERRK